MSRRSTVLIVDDEPFVLDAASRLLQQAGFSVYTCELWSSVLGLIREVQPDLVLLDYNMPALKGDDICGVLKRNILNCSTRIVLFSSEEEPFLADITQRCGADGYIRKNQSPAQILQAVNGALGIDAGDLAVALN